MCKEWDLAMPLMLVVHPSEEGTGIPTKGQVTQRPRAWETFSWEGCWLLAGEDGVAVKRGSTPGCRSLSGCQAGGSEMSGSGRRWQDAWATREGTRDTRAQRSPDGAPTACVS